MKTFNALRLLAELSAGQWGQFTAAQAADRGVSRVTLARLVDAEQLVRLAHGVYRDAGVPPDQFEDLRTAWLSIYPQLRAEQRLQPGSLESTPASGTSAATLHGLGDHYVGRFEFTTPVRRQSQRPQLRYRIRELDPVDVTIKEGLPVTTLERTIADLVEERYDLSNVAIAVRDADRQRPLDEKRMVELLSPLAARNGVRRGDGAALWKRLTELAGIDLGSTVDKIAADDLLARLIASKYLAALGVTLDELLSRPLRSSDDPPCSEPCCARLHIPPRWDERQTRRRQTLRELAQQGVDDQIRCAVDVVPHGSVRQQRTKVAAEAVIGQLRAEIRDRQRCGQTLRPIRRECGEHVLGFQA